MIKMKRVTEKEYEAMSVVRDILVVLYSEIRDNIGDEPEYLFEAYNYVNGLTEMMQKDL